MWINDLGEEGYNRVFGEVYVLSLWIGCCFNLVYLFSLLMYFWVNLCFWEV